MKTPADVHSKTVDLLKAPTQVEDEAPVEQVLKRFLLTDGLDTSKAKKVEGIQALFMSLEGHPNG